MKNLSKNPLAIQTILVITVLLLIALLFYFFSGENEPKKVVDAKVKVQTEKKKLDQMSDIYKAERDVIRQIQEQYNILRNGVIKNTDIFFKKPDSENPEILFSLKDKKLEKEMNERRLKITKLLEEWDRKMAELDSDTLYGKSIPSLSSIVGDAKKDIDYIKQYIKELNSIIENISPSNQIVTQIQIESYQATVEASLSQIEQVSSNIVAIENSIPAIYGITPTSPTVTNTPTPTPTPPVVTNSQIQNQQETVNQAVEEQNVAQNNPTPPPPPPPPTVPNYTYIYYPSYQTLGGSQTLMEYLQSLPAPIIDRSGWPDRIPDADPSKPSITN